MPAEDDVGPTGMADVDPAVIARKWRNVGMEGSAGALSVPEYRVFWEAMAADRMQAASVLVYMVARLLMQSQEDRSDLQEALASVTTDVPISPVYDRTRGTPARATEGRRLTGSALVVRHQLLNSIYYIALMYPFDPYHTAVQRALDRWKDDMRNYVDRDPFESEIQMFLPGVSELETAENVKKQVLALLMTSNVAADLRSLYNGQPMASIKSLAEAMLLPSVYAVTCREDYVAEVLQQLLQQLTEVGSMTDTNFFHLVVLVKEFVYLLRDSTEELWSALEAALKPYFAWPKPFCRIARDLTVVARHNRQRRQLLTCVQFLAHHAALVKRESEFRDRIHVVINPHSRYGSAIRAMLDDDFLQQMAIYDKSHRNRCRFLYLCFSRLLNDGEPVYHLRDADKMLVEKWFHTAVDLVQRAWRLYDRPFDPSDRADTERAFATDGLDEAGEGGVLSAAALEALRGVRQEVRESLLKGGKTLTVVPPEEIFDVNGPASTPITVANLEEGAFHITNAVSLEASAVGAFKTLDQLLSAAAARSSDQPVPVKVVLVGGDSTFHNFVCGYVALRSARPQLFSAVDLRVFLVPGGRRNFFCEYLAIADVWYGRNIFLLTRSALYMAPGLSTGPSKASKDETAMRSDLLAALKLRDDVLRRRAAAPQPEKAVVAAAGAASLPRAKRLIVGVSPASSLRMAVDHYVRQAEHVLPVHLYQAELVVLLHGAPTKRVVPFAAFVEVGPSTSTMMLGERDFDGKLHRTGAKQGPPVAPKPTRLVLPELAISAMLVNVSGMAAGTVTVPPTQYHAVIVSNLPRSADHVRRVKPHGNALELSLFDEPTRRSIRGLGTGGVDDPPVHYVTSVEMEDVNKRPFDVLIDGRSINGVQSVKIAPIKVGGTAEDASRILTLPLMTFVPVE